jgi:hypothetical protein
MVRFVLGPDTDAAIIAATGLPLRNLKARVSAGCSYRAIWPVDPQTEAMRGLATPTGSQGRSRYLRQLSLATSGRRGAVAGIVRGDRR